MEWDLTDDKGRISEVFALAKVEGPQTVVDGEQRFDVIACQSVASTTPREPSANREPPKTFKEWLLNGPSLEGVDLERDKSPMRDIEF